MRPRQRPHQQIFAWKSTLYSSYESWLARNLALEAACFSFVEAAKRLALDAVSIRAWSLYLRMGSGGGAERKGEAE